MVLLAAEPKIAPPLKHAALNPSKTKLECDYDVNPSVLYQAIEAREWEFIQNLFSSSLSSNVDSITGKVTDLDESSVSLIEQGNTWVVRKEKDGRLRWKMLPLHATMIFKSPCRIVEAILSVAPTSVNIKDDRGMLPLHLAFRHGMPDEVITKLISMSPGSIEVKDRKGRVPLQCGGLQRKLMHDYVYLALDFERQKVSNELKQDYEKKLDVLKNAYEQEIADLKKSVSQSEAEVKSARTACNAMMTRVSNMCNIETQLRDENEKVRQQKSSHEGIIATLEAKINHINKVYCTKDQLHAESISRLEEKKCVTVTLEEKVENMERSIADQFDQYNRAIEVIAEKDDLISNLYDKIAMLEGNNRAKEEETAIAVMKLKQVEDEVTSNKNESTVFKDLAEQCKSKTSNLESTIENLTIRNSKLEDELEKNEMRLKHQGEWLENANQMLDTVLAAVGGGTALTQQQHHEKILEHAKEASINMNENDEDPPTESVTESTSTTATGQRDYLVVGKIVEELKSSLDDLMERRFTTECRSDSSELDE